MRADRLVSLALLLQARGRTSARALAAELEVSVRTVYRDIEALNLAGVPVITESGPGGGCWLLDGYRFPLRGLSDDEAAALLVLGVPAAVAELGLADALAAAQRKIRLTTAAGASGGGGRGGGGDISGGDDGPASALVHLDMPRWFGASEPVPWLRTLAAAVHDRRQLRLGYERGSTDDATTRVICPLGLVNKAGIWYLVAAGGRRAAGGLTAAGGKHPAGGLTAAGGKHPAGGLIVAGESRKAGGDATAEDDPAVFRVGRVVSAHTLPEAFTRPPGFDLAAFWGRWSDSFMTSRPKLEVRVRASPDAISVFPKVFGDPGQRALDAAPAADEHGFRDVTLTFEHEAAAVQRLAGFGGQMEVLSPMAVRDRLIATARELLEHYRAGQ
jgi:predicted DNA-binding transcriptional regulator YafY